MRMETSDPEYSCHAILLVRGRDLEPSRVSTALRMRPSQAWRRGENSPSAGASHRYEFGGWKKFLPKAVQALPLDLQLLHWVRRLELAALPLPASARSEELAFRCNVHTSTTASIVLPPRLLARMSALGVELQLSVLVASES